LATTEPESDDRLARWLGFAVVAASAIVCGSWVLTAAAHVHDDYGIDHVAGTWLALARDVNHGASIRRSSTTARSEGPGTCRCSSCSTPACRT